MTQIELKRDRLLASLSDGAAYPLTLLVGAPGIGKSTAVRHWASEIDSVVAMVELDRFARHPARMARLVAQSIPVNDVSRADPVGVRSAEALATWLIGLLDEVQESVVVVLEEAQHLIGTDSEEILRNLVAGISDRFRCVVSTQHDPMLAVPAMRQANTIHEIREHALRFTNDEAAWLMEALGCSFDDAQVVEVNGRVSGRPLDLRLIGSCVAAGVPSSELTSALIQDSGSSTDFLVARHLSAVNEEMATVLKRASVAPFLDPALASELTGVTGAEALIEGLAASGYPISLVDGRYVLHPQVRFLLSARLAYEGPENLAAAKVKAAKLLDDEGEHLAAIELAIEAEDWRLAGNWLTSRSWELLHEGDAVLEELVDRLPPLTKVGEAGGASVATARQRSVSSAPAGLDRLLHHRLRGESEAMLAAAASVAHTAPGHPQIKIAHAYSHIWLGDIAGARSYLLEARTSATRASDPASGVEALGMLAFGSASEGHLNHALRLTADAFELAGHWGLESDRALISACLASCIVARRRGELVQAQHSFRDAAVLAILEGGDLPQMVAGMIESSRIWISRGDLREASEVLSDARGRFGDLPEFATRSLDFASSWIALLRGDGHPTAPGLRLVDIDTATAAERLILARLALVEGDLEQATRLEATLTESDEPDPVARVEASKLRALMREKEGDVRGATRALLDAVDYAEPEGMIDLIVDETDHVQALLGAALRGAKPTAWRESVVRYLRARRELGDWRQRTGPRGRGAETLTDKERAVLRYLPTRLTNQEIAKEMYVSVHTVKTHLRNVYRKLEVNSRKEAVAKARQTGYL